MLLFCKLSNSCILTKENVLFNSLDVLNHVVLMFFLYLRAAKLFAVHLGRLMAPPVYAVIAIVVALLFHHNSIGPLGSIQDVFSLLCGHAAY